MSFYHTDLLEAKCHLRREGVSDPVALRLTCLHILVLMSLSLLAWRMGLKLSTKGANRPMLPSAWGRTHLQRRRCCGIVMAVLVLGAICSVNLETLLPLSGYGAMIGLTPDVSNQSSVPHVIGRAVSIPTSRRLSTPSLDFITKGRALVSRMSSVYSPGPRELLE